MEWRLCASHEVMENPPAPRTVKLGDILPSLANFESVLGSLKSYRLWPVVLREALLDRAISGIVCTEEESEEAESEADEDDDKDIAQIFYAVNQAKVSTVVILALL